jgi:hypothetical protein
MAQEPSSSGSRSSLSFEDFIEAATTAALRAANKVAAETAKPGEAARFPWPIWIGLILNDREIQVRGDVPQR